jgi:hypothetical protein
MSAWGNTDNQISTPKFPLERRARDVNQFTVNAVTIAGSNSANTLYIANANTSGITTGMYVSGNNLYLNSAVPGFFLGNVTVVSVNSSAVVLSTNVTANVNIGDTFEIDTAIAYPANKPVEVYYNANTYLVDAGRIANATFGNGVTFDSPVAHTGWNKVSQGRGYVYDIALGNVSSSLTYSNAYITFSAPTGSPNASAANGYITAYGNVVTATLTSNGASYNNIPTATISGANNSTLTVTVIPGGRLGRIQAETLVALSTPNVTNANSGGTYFPGL